MADLALPDELVEGAEGLLERHASTSCGARRKRDIGDAIREHVAGRTAA